MVTIFKESFETDGIGTRYQTSIPEFSDGAGDFFTRTDGSNIGGFYDVTGADGNFYFAAMDIDGEGDAPTQVLSVTDIDIAGFSDLSFSILLAEDDDGTNQDWDISDFFKVEYQIDGGGFQNLLAIESVPDGDNFNAVPAEDTDFDGDGDGAEITDVFSLFSKDIADTGALLDLRLTWNLDSGDEDLAIDDIKVSGLASETVIAFGLVDGADQNLINFAANPDNSGNNGAFAGSNFDVFGITDRSVNFDFADDSAGSFATDAFGVVGTGDLDPFFGVEDLDNGNNPGGTGTATWTFDISGATSLSDITIDFAAMGDFEAGDNAHTITASIDGGADIVLFAIDADNDDVFDYTMEGGAIVTLNDPLKIDGVVIPNSFTTFTSSALAGLSGSTLEVTLTSAANNGGAEVFAMRDIVVNGVAGGSQGTIIAIAAEDAVKAEGDAGTTPFTFTVTRTGDTTAAGTVDYAVTSSAADAADFGGSLPSGTVSFAADETVQTVTIDVSGDIDPEQDETFTVTLSNASGGAVISGLGTSANGVIQNDDGVAITLISEIQGDASTQISASGRDDASPLLGSIVTIEGVVVGDFQDGTAGVDGDLNGFYVQEEDTDADANALTSEGIFVFDGSNPAVDVQNGEIVRVTGTVTEFFGETQLSDVTVEVIASGDNSALASAATLSFPVAATTTNADGELIADLEAYEGMQVTIPQELTISDLFTLGRFGDMGLHADGRLEAFTQANAPSVAGFQAYQDLAVRNTVVLDDGQTFQNPTEIPFEITGEGGNIPGQLDAGDDLTAGDTISDLTGVVRFGRGSGGSGDEIYRINATEAPVIENTNPRETEAPDVGGSLKVAAFNVLNFFTSIDDDRGRNNNPLNAGPTPLEPRGANDLTTASGAVARSTQAQTDPLAEFNRQLDKLVSALSEADADIFGLVEIENEFPGFVDATNLGGQTAVERLISELNTVNPSADYKFAAPSNGDTFGDSGDAISVGLIYNAATVELAEGTTVEVLRDADLAALGVDPGVPVFDGASTNRAPIAATFTELSTGESFSVAVNHFKSKGSPGPAGDGDLDIGDGVGAANQTRLNASIALDAWLKTDPTGSGDPDYMIIGDLNAYAQEDPIQYLLDEGYVNLAPRFLEEGEFEYSFGFPVSLSDSPASQSFGALDYALASASLVDQITGAAEWHINADEAVIFDYNLEFKPQGQADDFFAADPFRSSDHDPMLVGLSLTSPAPETATARLEFQEARGRDKVVYSLEGEIEGVERLNFLSRDIEVDASGITISADDGIRWSPEFLTTAGKGLGIYSLRGDRFFGQEKKTIDDKEVMRFELEDIAGFGDATEVMFEFAKVRRSGEVELTFFDDGTEVETVLLAVQDGAVRHDLDGDQTFDRVDLSVDGKLRLELGAVEFERVETDVFDFI